MFTRHIATILTFLFFVFPFMTSATAIVARGGGGGGGGGGGSSQCNTGSIECCNSVQSADSSAVTSVLGLLGLAVGSITGQVGLGCNPISVIGVGGNSCSAQPACCTGNRFGSLLVVGCDPINLNG